MIVDGSKEQVECDFARKCKKAGCYLEQSKPCSPWENSDEGGIEDLKRGDGCNMLKSGSPKRLWDDCVEIELYVRLHTAHNIYCLNGETPETIASGETSDISQLCELDWYEWIMFRDLVVSFLEDNIFLGRYLGPIIDVVLAMTSKIMKSNGEVVNQLTY